MDTISGTISLRLTAEGSKSEGHKAVLCSEEGNEYTLYRKDMLPVNDPFFAPYDNRHVTVKGAVEQSREHTSICVEAMTLDDGTEIEPQPEALPFTGSIFLTDNMPKAGETEESVKRLPRKLKKLRKKQLKR